MRILSIDYGGRRIGLAVCDPLGITVRPLMTVDRRKDRDAVGTIVAKVAELEVDKLLLGMPFDTGGIVGDSAKRVIKFRDRLLARLAEHEMDIPLDELDESYTTTEANARLRDRGVRADLRREVIDQEAAAVLLEAYLRSAAAPQ